MSKNMPVREFIRRLDAGDFANSDVLTQVEAGWYDWFCRDSSLVRKTVSLGRKAKRLAKSSKIDQDAMYVWFKNNCPLYGRLYDDLRFADIATGDVVFTVVPRSGHDSHDGRAEVWGRENGFDGPLVVGTWKDVLAFFDVR